MEEPDYAADRQSAVDWARAVLADEQTVILDTETTGLRSGAEICDIAVIDAKGAVLLDTLVRPAQSMPEEATAIHGLTDELLASAPGWAEVWPQLQAVLAGRRLVIYNANFDRRLIAQSGAFAGIACSPAEVPLAECAMLRYADYCGDWNSHFGNYRYQKLPKASHRALGDCRATLRVLERMAGVANTPISVLVPEAHAEDWRWSAHGGAPAALAAFVADLVGSMHTSGPRAELTQAWWGCYQDSLVPAGSRYPRRRLHPVVRWEEIEESKEATDCP